MTVLSHFRILFLHIYIPRKNKYFEMELRLKLHINNLRKNKALQLIVHKTSIRNLGKSELNLKDIQTC